MFKVNNKNTRTTLMPSVSIVDFEQVNFRWVAHEDFLCPPWKHSLSANTFNNFFLDSFFT